MNVISKLAVSLHRRDEVPNVELAKKISEKNDKTAVKELMQHLNDADKDIQNDCIKVLYEIGERKPALVAPYYKELISLLGSKNNRMMWGAMTALDTIAEEKPEEIYKALPAILDAAEKGSVITKDHAINILIKLTSEKKYAEKTFPLLAEFLQKSLVNQLPMYAEKAAPVISEKNKPAFLKILNTRLNDVEQESKRKRIQRVIHQLRS